MTHNKQNIKDFKKIMSHFATGICIVTVIDSDSCLDQKNDMIKFFGVTINSFNSVSLEPPLILYSLGKKNSNFDVFLNAKHFFISILEENQEEISNFFAFNKDFSKFSEFEIKEFDGKKFVKIKDCLSGIACEKYCDYDGGDHRIILGKTIAFDFCDVPLISKKQPLLYFDSKYRKIDLPND
jgi:flavin reductase (DIM6/NTAB) family NADH-FMN oxidoreductase RutF